MSQMLRRPWPGNAGKRLRKIRPDLTGDRQEILSWNWTGQPTVRPGGSHDKAEDAATQQPQ